MLHRRLGEMNQRLLVRRWEYRQRKLSKGVWLRLRRLLIDAESAWELEADAADVLRDAGVTPEAAGLELHPPKEIFFVQPEQLERLDARRAIAARLGADFLEARVIALVPHPGFRGRG